MIKFFYVCVYLFFDIFGGFVFTFFTDVQSTPETYDTLFNTLYINKVGVLSYPRTAIVGNNNNNKIKHILNDFRASYLDVLDYSRG